MAAYPYVPATEKIAQFFKKIGDIGVPEKFSNKTLKSLGFTSSNDARLVNLVKFLGLVEQNGTPTGLWKEHRTKPRVAMAKAIHAAYSDLFQHYSDANQRDDEALRTYFAANSSVGAAAVGMMVSTFKTICRLADFSSVDQMEHDVAQVARTSRRTEHHPRVRANAGTDGMTVNINIQLQLPADATPETYERFFEAMRKHVLAPIE